MTTTEFELKVKKAFQRYKYPPPLKGLGDSEYEYKMGTMSNSDRIALNQKYTRKIEKMIQEDDASESDLHHIMEIGFRVNEVTKEGVNLYAPWHLDSGIFNYGDALSLLESALSSKNEKLNPSMVCATAYVKLAKRLIADSDSLINPNAYLDYLGTWKRMGVKDVHKLGHQVIKNYVKLLDRCITLLPEYNVQKGLENPQTPEEIEKYLSGKTILPEAEKKAKQIYDSLIRNKERMEKMTEEKF